MTEHQKVITPVIEAEEILQRRAETLARNIEDSSTAERTTLMVFRVGEFWYAVRTEDVREIIQNLAVAPIPCVPEFVRGVLNVRGEIVSVTDGAVFLGSTAGSLGRDSVAVVLENAECQTAFVVDEVGGIIEVPTTGVEPPLPVTGHAEPDLLVATVFLGDRLVSLLNVDRILRPVSTVAQ
ncbi:MAG: chemotaxis protein CheW [Coriobacteriia bacterium]|nr:chemotaxis protein CheW [Coriobacteriia bacterium]